MSSSRSSGLERLGAPPLLAPPPPPAPLERELPPPLGRELLSPLKSASAPPLPSRLPRSCMRSPTISVEYFSTPSLSVYLRVCSRPSMYTERPFLRYSPATSAWR